MARNDKKSVLIDGTNYISKEQFRIMCKISKRTAKLLLDYKIVPSKNTNKLTRCYIIKMTDAKEFLDNRDMYLKKIPQRDRVSNKMRRVKKSFYIKYDFTNEDIKIAKEFLSDKFKEYPDMMMVKQVAASLGLADETIIRYIKKGHFETRLLGVKFMVSKESLIEFATSRDFYAIKSLSAEFNELLLSIFQLLNKPLIKIDDIENISISELLSSEAAESESD